MTRGSPGSARPASTSPSSSPRRSSSPRLVLAVPRLLRQPRRVTPRSGRLLVVGVDVAHVYGTLYRTYLDPAEFRRRRSLYVLAPLLGWLAFAALYSLGAMVFWRALAYLAVFHFVRQQYGFMMLYGRPERRCRMDRPGGDLRRDAVSADVVAHPCTQLLLVHARATSSRCPRRCLATSRWLAYAGDRGGLSRQGGAGWRRGAGFNWPRNLLLGVHRPVLVGRHCGTGQRPRLHRGQRAGAWPALHGADLAVWPQPVGGEPDVPGGARCSHWAFCRSSWDCRSSWPMSRKGFGTA